MSPIELALPGFSLTRSAVSVLTFSEPSHLPCFPVPLSWSLWVPTQYPVPADIAPQGLERSLSSTAFTLVCVPGLLDQLFLIRFPHPLYSLEIHPLHLSLLLDSF